MSASDVSAVERALARGFPKAPTDGPFEWPSPPLNVLDCVLSLNRNYDRFCKPRVQRFSDRHPELKTLAGLRQLIKKYPSPLAFSLAELAYRDGPRAQTLLDVIEYLLEVQKQFRGKSEWTRLRKWAKSVRPQDRKSVGIHGFGLSGFQYLRMLFGAQTTKPDLHIRRYVSSIVGHPVSDTVALELLEEGAKRTTLPLRSLDYAIWSQSARSKARQSA
jgi:hypothetical protein